MHIVCESTITAVAAMLTDDPDIIREAGMSDVDIGEPADIGTDPNTIDTSKEAPLSATDINAQAEEIAGGGDASAEIADQMQQQKEMMQAQETERARTLEPVMADIDNVLGQVTTGIRQQAAQMAGGEDQSISLQDQIAQLSAAIQVLQKTAF